MTIQFDGMPFAEALARLSELKEKQAERTRRERMIAANLRRTEAAKGLRNFLFVRNDRVLLDWVEWDGNDVPVPGKNLPRFDDSLIARGTLWVPCGNSAADGSPLVLGIRVNVSAPVQRDGDYCVHLGLSCDEIGYGYSMDFSGPAPGICEWVLAEAIEIRRRWLTRGEKA